MRINEIFYSIQGEGHWSGTPSVFIRFSGCNLKCPFCDTDHEASQEYDIETLMDEIAAFSPCRHLVITGGEPSLQLSQELVDRLSAAGYYISVETNGTRALPDGIHWVTCSPKFQYVTNARIALSHIDELKVVYSGKDQDMTPYESIPAKFYSIQPCDTGDEDTNRKNLADALAFIMANPRWRLSLQMHKMLGVR